MAERQTGLRFDIYERVHLADSAVGVQELDEVELVPHIQVYTEGEQALLRGNLYLTGSYAGESGMEARTLEHMIPVEITLPLNRIQDVNQVYVDIDNFDVDLLSPRSLNVTGVLTLHGIEMLAAPEEDWQEEEETVFVSRASEIAEQAQLEQEQAAVQGQARVQAQEQAAVQGQAKVQAQEESFFRRENLWEPEERQDRIEEPSAPSAGWAIEPEKAKEQEEIEEYFFQADEEIEVPLPEAKEAVEAPEAEPFTDQESVPIPVVSETEEKKELKIGFGSKPAAESPNLLKSMIHNRDVRQPETAEDMQELAPTPRTDALEWKRLFARGEREENTFSRVRVCIVQKEETLESIAQRYSKNPREILLYNRVTEQDLSEGKVLIIPK